MGSVTPSCACAKPQLRMMAVLVICLIISGVLIIAVINVIVVRNYMRNKVFVDGKPTMQVYEPAEKDNLGHLYY